MELNRYLKCFCFLIVADVYIIHGKVQIQSRKLLSIDETLYQRCLEYKELKLVLHLQGNISTAESTINKKLTLMLHSIANISTAESTICSHLTSSSDKPRFTFNEFSKNMNDCEMKFVYSIQLHSKLIELSKQKQSLKLWIVYVPLDGKICKDMFQENNTFIICDTFLLNLSHVLRRRKIMWNYFSTLQSTH